MYLPVQEGMRARGQARPYPAAGGGAMPASLTGRLLAILSVADLGLAAGGAATASPATRATPRASTTSAAYPGPSIKGPVTWTDSISTQDSTETQNGKFTLDLRSTLEPPSYAPVFTTHDSTYQVTDNYYTQYQVNGCTITGTGTIKKSGTLTDNDLQPGVDWLNTDGPLSATELGFTISLHMKEPLHWTSPCGIQGPPDQPVTFAPACLNDPGDDGAFGGPFGGKRDTVNVGCHGSVGTSYQWKISGTLHVDAYVFVLPRSVYTAKQWKFYLLKPHHDHPSADIPVPVGTRFFAVTAGDIAVINQKVGCAKALHSRDLMASRTRIVTHRKLMSSRDKELPLVCCLA